jgi:hypothetical protein
MNRTAGAFAVGHVLQNPTRKFKMICDGLVTLDLITQMRKEMWPRGIEQMTQDLAAVEPSLAKSLQSCVRNGMKMLDGHAVPPAVREPLEEFMLATALTAVQSLRRAHYQLWRRSEIGKRVAWLSPDLVQELGDDRDVEDDWKLGPDEE